MFIVTYMEPLVSSIIFFNIFINIIVNIDIAQKYILSFREPLVSAI
jgi:hypothetical protein